MRDVFVKLCRAYDLGDLQGYATLDGGTVSDVWLLMADGLYFVRTIRDAAQGELELAITRHLFQNGFSGLPVIYPTEDQEPAVEIDGVWYQVQGMCAGQQPMVSRPGMPGRIARLVTDFLRAMEGCAVSCPVRDRFDLKTVWSKYRAYWPELDLPLTQEEADLRVARLLAEESCETRLIHGDLGIWNMVETESGDLLIVDFGDSCWGDPYYDLAAALCGIVNHSGEQARRGSAEEFLSVCRERMAVDVDRLAGQVRLWAWRGMARCLQESNNWKEMAQKFWFALNWMEENLHDL